MDPVTSSSPDSQATPSTNASLPLWMKRVPMITGVLAGLAGFLTVRSANMSNQAIYNSNQAVLHQALASDAWAEYQADSVKRHIDQTAVKTDHPDADVANALTADAKKQRDNQDSLKQTAAAEEALRGQELENGQKKLAVKDLLDYAGVAAQLGIALASVSALTRKQSAFNVALIVGAVALLITGYALAEPFIVRLIHRH